MPKLHATLVAVALVLHPAAWNIAGAQMLEAQPGTRIRIEAPGVVAGRFDGIVLSRTPDTLTIASQNAAPLAIPVARITGMEVSRGSSRADGALRGVQWGAGVGAILGLIYLPVVHACTNCVSKPGDGEVLENMVIGGTIWGAAIGAIVGRERWERFELAPRVALSGGGSRRLLIGLGR